MKKIIFFIATLCSGGAERVVSILSKNLTDYGYTVEILMYYDKPVFYEIDSRINVVSVVRQTESYNILRNLIWMRHYFRTNAEVIVSFLSSFNILALLSNLFTGIPIIISERTDPRRGSLAYRILRDTLYNLADHIVVQSKYSNDYFSLKLRSKMTVIYNPIDVKDFAGKAITAPKEKLIVTVGRLIPVKNQAMLIKSFSNIKKQFPDYKLIIFGEGECRQELQQIVNELDLQNSIQLYGNNKNLFKELIHAELFVLTSNYEGMSNALLESMCLGLPVISTKVSGATDFIISEVNGILIDKKDDLQLSCAIKKVLSDKKLQHQYGVRATEIIKYVSVDAIIPKWTKIIEEVLKDA